LPWNGGDSLYDPAGQHRTGHALSRADGSRFNGAPWLASAAYNAGAGRVNQWLDVRGTLPPDLFVATIPFKETREYVARVMYYSVIYDWRLHGNAAPISTRMTPIGQPYSRPNAQDREAQRSISCAAPPEAAPARFLPRPAIDTCSRNRAAHLPRNRAYSPALN
jgi:soluble lytic murein transglycosylase